jgi:hypothetical protein
MDLQPVKSPMLVMSWVSHFVESDIFTKCG